MTDTTKDPAGAVIAEQAAEALATKADHCWARMVALSIAAGGFIAFGAIAYLIVQAGGGAVSGPTQLLSGAAFSVGLILVMVTGTELFTGNTMMVLPAATGGVTAARVAGAWTLVWVGNLVGSVAVAGLFVAAGGLEGLDGTIGDAAAATMESKLDKSVLATLTSGILANMLVCLAVWMAMFARTLSGKVAVIVGPVAVFVAAGFEHSVANMSLLPIGWAADPNSAVPWGAGLRNLAFSTVGNVIGGASISLILAYGHGKLSREE
jgi:formate/nitrite transporter